MTERTLVIAILVALILLWFAETLNMKKTSKVLGGAIDLAFAILRSRIKLLYYKKSAPTRFCVGAFLLPVKYCKILCVNRIVIVKIKKCRNCFITLFCINKACIPKRFHII